MVKTQQTVTQCKNFLFGIISTTFSFLIITAWVSDSFLLIPKNSRVSFHSRGKALFVKNAGGKQDAVKFRSSSSSSLNASIPFVAEPDTSDEITSSDISYISLIPTTSNSVPTNELTESSVSADDFDAASFGTIFRQCAPYIAMHRNSVLVIHIPGHVLQNRNTFDAISDDISILHLLGVQIVLVVGVRDQLDVKVQQSGSTPSYHSGMRVTDEDTLRWLKETSGSARFEIESSLARGFRGRSPGQQGINVVSGNFFYTAKPLGVRNGIDFKFTGEVRRIESENIKKRLESGDVVLLTSLGYSPSGESFNVPSESLAAECAVNLKASKIIFLTEGELLWDTRKDKNVQSLRLGQAVALLDLWGIRSATYNEVDADVDNCNLFDTFDANTPMSNVRVLGGLNKQSPYPSEKSPVSSSKVLAQNSAIEDVKTNADPSSLSSASALQSSGCDDGRLSSFKRLIARSVYSLNGGVKRAHLLYPAQGQLLKELYTRDGAGILISRDVYEGIRQAQASDVRMVQELINPLVQEGILVHRSRDQLEKDMQNCYVLTRDGTMLACAMLKRFGQSHAEVSCLAVHPGYRRDGRGETILAYLERRAITLGIKTLFVLSTRTMLWFEERGFVLSEPSELPVTRAYNSTRGSKVYIKQLGSQRDVDAEELLWNM